MEEYITIDFGKDWKEELFNRRSQHIENGDLPNGLQTHPSHVEAMEKIARNMSISGELFEKLYLSPQNLNQVGDLRKRFANPTPVALVGLIMAISPAACMLMGWRTNGGEAYHGAANNGAYWFFGGMLMLLGGIFEFFLGNTFSFVVFSTFAAYWMSYGATLSSQFDAFTSYALAGETTGSGADSPVFQADFGFFLLFMGLLSLVFLVCSIRTNIVLFTLFLMLVPSYACFTAAFWWNATGNYSLCLTLTKAGGAGLFVVAMCSWYLFAVQVFTCVDLAILPVGDLSHIITPASERAARKLESQGPKEKV